MVYFKIVPGKFKSKETIRNEINYVLNPMKNPHNVFHAYGTTPEDIKRMADSFYKVQRAHDKTSCKRMIHCILAFSKGEKHSPKEYLRYGYEVMDFFDSGTQYVFALHEKNNTGEICLPHIHILINTVNAKTGKRLSIDKAMLYALHRHINNIFKSADFELFPEHLV